MHHSNLETQKEKVTENKIITCAKLNKGRQLKLLTTIAAKMHLLFHFDRLYSFRNQLAPNIWPISMPSPSRSAHKKDKYPACSVLTTRVHPKTRRENGN